VKLQEWQLFGSTFFNVKVKILVLFLFLLIVVWLTIILYALIMTWVLLKNINDAQIGDNNRILAINKTGIHFLHVKSHVGRYKFSTELNKFEKQDFF
jgi:hypothetical protein